MSYYDIRTFLQRLVVRFKALDTMIFNFSMSTVLRYLGNVVRDLVQYAASRYLAPDIVLLR